MNYKDLFQSIEGFNKLVNKELPVRTSLKVAQIVRIVNTALEPAISVRDSIVKTKSSNQAEFKKAIEELLNEEVELSIKKLPIKDLEAIDLTPNDLIALEPFLELDEED